MIKTLDRKSLFYLIIILIVAAFIFGGLIYLIAKPSSVSDCKDIKCIKSFATSKDFNPEECKNVPSDFRNDCYYTYEIENTLAKKTNPGKYCGPINNENLQADCFYKTRGVALITQDTAETIYKAMDSLDNSNCDKITVSELKEQCINSVNLMKKAIDGKSSSLCFDESVKVPPSIKQSCLTIFLRDYDPVSMPSKINEEAMDKAMDSLDNSNCDKITAPELKKLCINGVTLIKKAVDAGDSSLCFDKSVNVSDLVRQFCVQKLKK